MPSSEFSLRSPGQGVECRLAFPSTSGVKPVWTLRHRGIVLIESGRFGLRAKGEGDLLEGATLAKAIRSRRDEKIAQPFGKSTTAHNRFRELLLEFRSAAGRRVLLRIRCFDDALAFRYEIPKQAGLLRIIIEDEGTTFPIADDPIAYVQYLQNYETSHEHNVHEEPASQIRGDALLDLPLTFARREGGYFAITEAALRRFAGLSLMRKGASHALSASLTPRQDGTKVDVALPMQTPWRVVLVGDSAGDLLESDTLFCLNDPPALKDFSWIRPGKMTWPWWNGHLFEAHPTQPILSFETVRKYIDFCAENGIAFHSVVSDEKDRPWYVQAVDGLFPGPGTEVTQVRPDLELPAILKYAKSKGVRLWTWVHQGALRGKVEDAFAAFERMGWSGMMVDFFDHDDQDTVEFAEEILQAAARHRILIHFHGIWKPTGWQRTYPHLMNHEGVLNLEYLKWGDTCPPAHDLRIAFTRAVAGPLDYHLGGFRAVSRPNFKPRNVGPNVLGTRCHMLAMYVCFDNPNPMVADYPASYRGQPGFDFVREVPTWWDETRVLVGEVGKTLVTARRKGAEWWLGGLSAGPAWDIEIPTSFLGKKKFRMALWQDSANFDADPNSLDLLRSDFPGGRVLKVRFQVDGGFVARFAPAK